MKNFSKFSDSSVAGRDFDSVRISIVSPERIRSWSYGEVRRPDTVNYRTIKPENGGLFCACIFGPIKDYECLCGKYKRMKYRGVVCEKCGVEVTTSKVRRERMGHIELAAPVVHIWFLRSLPSRISVLLDMQYKEVEKILQFDTYVVSNPKITTLRYGQLINEEEYHDLQNTLGEDAFDAGTGAEVIQKMLAELNLEELRTSLRTRLVETNSEIKRKKIVKRLKLVEDFIESGNKPEWMVLNVLPVIPPDLRPLVMLDGGRFATSDLNELYRRVINRNNRLRRLIELRAPNIIVRNEKRMLQEAVDALFDNSRRSKSLKNANKRPYKSLADMVKGKQGRFRQNLLGKRVDYSGRSVIVVGPELRLHQCGLPKMMALELFKPLIYCKLMSYGIAGTLKAAKKIVDAEKTEVWDILDEVIREHPVLLNRAPTLHRLGIQAFEPVLTDGKAIRLHPLVCAAFNADFDGDQMAVHVPLSTEAQIEARVLMMSSNNVLSPANGKPVIVPTQDIILGLYYITLALDKQDGEGMVFAGLSEIEHAINAGVLSPNAKIKCRCKCIDLDGNVTHQILDTTPGRVMVYELVPGEAKLGFDVVNKVLNKKEVSILTDLVYRECGARSTVIFADRIMQLGFKWACKSGISISKNDMVIPSSKVTHVTHTTNEVREYENQYAEGLITKGEKYNKVIDAWSHCSDKITKDMMDIMSGHSSEVDQYGGIGQDGINNVFIMADSGARGSAAQLKQIAGMRGLMTKPSGEIIEIPIISNFKEGLTVLEYFTSTHGARKGFVDTALKTANSGYLTRKLVDVSQDCIVMEDDCGTEDGIVAKALVDNGVVVVTLSESIMGRTAAIAVRHPMTDQLIVDKGELIDEAKLELIEESGIDHIKIRSTITCKSVDGVCSKCYGRDLATGDLVNVGEAVGVIAAQSIGEPGTQLTMRTFHIGGAAQKTAIQSDAVATISGIVRYIHKNVVADSKGATVVMSRNCEAVVVDDRGNEKERYKIPYGSKIIVNHDEKVKIGAKIAEWDPFTTPIITEKSGKIRFVDLIDGVSIKEVQDEATGIVNRVIVDSKQYSRGGVDLQPKIVLIDDEDNIQKLANGLEARYFLPVGAVLRVTDGCVVYAGDIIARIPRESSKSRDITGGLPRVIELVEARNSKDHPIINEIDGYVEFGRDYKSKRRIIVRSAENDDHCVEYLIPRGRHITVHEGDYVSKGDMLMEGNPSLHDILRILGVEALTHYMIREVQQVYRLQGVFIDNKHIEVILRQMLQKVEVVAPNGTTFITGEHVDKKEFEEVNAKTVKLGYKPAVAIPVLQGITKASLQTESFFSAASFQETTRILTDAAVAGKVDRLRGLKENVIVGRLIPAGTGLYSRILRKKAYKLDQLFEQEKRKQSRDAKVVADTSGGEFGVNGTDIEPMERYDEYNPIVVMPGGK